MHGAFGSIGAAEADLPSDDGRAVHICIAALGDTSVPIAHREWLCSCYTCSECVVSMHEVTDICSTIPVIDGDLLRYALQQVEKGAERRSLEVSYPHAC